MTRPDFWYLTANCHTDNRDALALNADRHPDLQYNGDSPEGGTVDARFLTASPTIEGVRTSGIAAIRAALHRWPTKIEPLTLCREVDGQVIDAETLRWL